MDTRKRGRGDFVNGGFKKSKPEMDSLSSGIGSKSKPCTKFFSMAGCPFGENCHFLHFVPGGYNVVSQMMNLAAPPASRPVTGPAPAQNGSSGPSPAGIKSKICNKFKTAEGCKFGDKCNFAHGEWELGKPIVPAQEDPRSAIGAIAARYSAPTVGHTPNYGAPSAGHTPNYGAPSAGHTPSYGASAAGHTPNYGAPSAAGHTPNYGAHSAGHTTNYAAPSSGHTPSYGAPAPGPTPNYGAPAQGAAASFGASATAKISVDASLAGAIIGKGGVNSKQICRQTGAKLSIRDHETDPNLRNIELEGSFEQIKDASAMVREFIVSIGSVSGPGKAAAPSGPGAGGAAAGPGNNFKTKLCEKFSKGSCTFGDRCHFAHGAAELRKTGV